MSDCQHPRSMGYEDEQGRSRCGACDDVWDEELRDFVYPAPPTQPGVEQPQKNEAEPWEYGTGTYRDSRWREARNLRGDGTIVCEETGVREIKGVCPIHKGDACLYSSVLLLAYWRERAHPAAPEGNVGPEPTEAEVERAAKALYDAQGKQNGGYEDDVPRKGIRTYRAFEWEELAEEDKSGIRRHARAALTAAHSTPEEDSNG